MLWVKLGYPKKSCAKTNSSAQDKRYLNCANNKVPTKEFNSLKKR
jgi:hypothetical protein